MAERAGADREADRRALPAPPVGRRRHAEAGRRRGVEPARRAVAGLIDRLRDRAGLPQPLRRPCRLARRRIGPRRHPGDLFEHPVEVIGAQLRRRREVGERRRGLRRLDRPAGPGHRLGLALSQARFVRTAALAGPEARRFRGRAGRVEADILRPGRPGGAARPAIDAGRAHRVDEAAIRRPVAPGDGREARGIVEGREAADGREVGIRVAHDSCASLRGDGAILAAPVVPRIPALAVEFRPRACRRYIPGAFSAPPPKNRPSGGRSGLQSDGFRAGPAHPPVRSFLAGARLSNLLRLPRRLTAAGPFVVGVARFVCRMRIRWSVAARLLARRPSRV